MGLLSQILKTKMKCLILFIMLVTGGALGKEFTETKKSNSNDTAAMNMVKYRIVGLEPNTLYRVEVLATTKTGAGRKKSLDVMTADRARMCIV
jgi:hypothetical protein